MLRKTHAFYKKLYYREFTFKVKIFSMCESISKLYVSPHDDACLNKSGGRRVTKIGIIFVYIFLIDDGTNKKTKKYFV